MRIHCPFVGRTVCPKRPFVAGETTCRPSEVGSFPKSVGAQVTGVEPTRLR